MEIVFATGNRHKVEEAAQILGPEFVLRTPAELGITEDIPETSDTLEGNALQKAEYVYKKTGLPCFSDDTGLFVDALGGVPGVLSARYAGPGKKAEDNVRKLLSELKDVPVEKDGRRMRTARFRCVVAYVSGSGEKVFEGRVEGETPERTASAMTRYSFRKSTVSRRLSPSLPMNRKMPFPTAARP